MRCVAVCPKRMFSVGIWSCSHCRNVASEMAGCSTDTVWLQQNFCRRSYFVFLEQCMFWCLRNEAGDGHFQTAGECHLPGTSVCYRIMTGTLDTSLNVNHWRTGSLCSWRRMGSAVTCLICMMNHWKNQGANNPAMVWIVYGMRSPYRVDRYSTHWLILALKHNRVRERVSSCLTAHQHKTGHSVPYTFSCRHLTKHRITLKKSNKLTIQRT